MGGARIVGLTALDQAYTPGGDPTQRREPQKGGANKNKVCGALGGGVGSGVGNSWLEGGGWVHGGTEERSPLPPGLVVSDCDQALQAVIFLKRYIPQNLFNSFDELLRDHIPQVPPAHTPTERQRAEHFARLTAEQEKLTKRLQEEKERIERARAKLQEEEELEGVTRQVETHKAEDFRRAREARVPRVEEVGPDMDIEGGTDAGEEVGVKIEAGKKRKVVRKARSSTRASSPNMGPEDLIRAICVLSEQDTERCKSFLLHDSDAGARMKEALQKRQDQEKRRLNLMHVWPRYLPRRTWLIRHVGRYWEAGGCRLKNVFFQGSGAQESFKGFKLKTKNKRCMEVFNFHIFKNRLRL